MYKRQVHHHVIADGLPHHGNDKARHHKIFALPHHGHLLRREQGQKAVEHAVVGVVDGRENGRNHHHGKNVRDIEDHAEEILAAYLFTAEDAGEHQRKGERHNGDSYNQQNGVLHRAYKVRVRKQLCKVFKAHKFLVRGIGAAAEQRHAEHVQRGKHHKNGEQDNCRGGAEKYEPLAALAFFHVLISFQSFANRRGMHTAHRRLYGKMRR